MIHKLLYETLVVESPRFFYAHIDSTDIASELLRPRNFGFATGKTLRNLSRFMALGFLALPISGLILGTIAIVYASIQSYTAPTTHWVFTFLTVLGDVTLALTITKLLVGYFVKFNFPLVKMSQPNSYAAETEAKSS